METRGPNTRDMGVEKRKIANRKSEKEDTITFIRLVREREREGRPDRRIPRIARTLVDALHSSGGRELNTRFFYYYYFTLARANFEYPIFL